MCVLYVCLLISGSLRSRLCNFQSLFPITIESFNWTGFHCEMENRMNWKFNWKHVSIVDTYVSAIIEFISLFSLLGLSREGKHQINKSKYRFFLSLKEMSILHWIKPYLPCFDEHEPTWSCSSALRCNGKLLISRNVQHHFYLAASWSGANWPLTIDPEGMTLILPAENLAHYDKRRCWCWWHPVAHASRVLLWHTTTQGNDQRVQNLF